MLKLDIKNRVIKDLKYAEFIVNMLFDMLIKRYNNWL